MTSTTYKYQAVSYLKRQSLYGGYLLITLALSLLPLERWELPFRLRFVDFIFVVLIVYWGSALGATNKKLYFPLLWPFFLIVFSSIVATLIGVRYDVSITALIQEIYLFLWFLSIANILIHLSLTGLNKLLKVWGLVAALETVTVVMGMLNMGPSIFYIFPDTGRALTSSDSGFNRGLGTYLNPNAAAAYLSISFFVILAADWPKWLKSILATWILIGIFASGSMGALISTSLGFMVLLLVFAYLRNPRLVTFGVGGVVILGSIVLLLMVIFGTPLLNYLGTVSDAQWLVLTLGRLPRSAMDRLRLVQSGLAIYLHRPFGIGPDGAAVLVEGGLHNDYLAFLVERGPFGLLGWLWLIGSGLWSAFDTARMQKKLFYRWQALALGVAFLSVMVNAFSHEVSHFRQVWMLMAFLFAGCTLLSQDARRRSPALLHARGENQSG